LTIFANEELFFIVPVTSVYLIYKREATSIYSYVSADKLSESNLTYLK